MNKEKEEKLRKKNFKVTSKKWTPIYFPHLLKPYDENEKCKATNQLTPFRPFKHEIVEKIVIKTLSKCLKNYKYSPLTAESMTREISTKLIRRIFHLEMDRYKLVTVVDIIENCGQDIRSVCRYLWDDVRDAVAWTAIKRQTFFATAVVICIYYD